MILHLPPDSPALVRGVAAVALVLHIGGGSVGLVSGAGALMFRKGGRWHRWSGNLFVAAMLTMAAVGAFVAPLLPQRSSVVPGLLAFYLVASGWKTVRRKAGEVGAFELGGMFFALSAAAIGVTFGLTAAGRPAGLLDGDPPATFFVFASFAAIAAALDLWMILRGGVSGADRLARHLWRMCAALLLAAISFFLGQSQVLPPFLRHSPLLFVPEIAVLGLMIFWLVRVRLVTGRGSVKGSGHWLRRMEPASSVQGHS